MQALQEVTDWEYPNHTYLVDGDRLVAYIKQGETAPVYFSSGIKGFSKSGRKFKEVKPSPFEQLDTDTDPAIIKVQGSQGQTYTVNTEEQTCSCPGFQFRGACKHVKELA